MNLAAQGDLGIDWAMLELQVAPMTSYATVSLAPVADATVRGGANAGNNFGTVATLTVRQDASTNNQQRAYLRWDLRGVSGQIMQARVVLTPMNVPTNGIEQGVAIANSNNWTEAGITWNNQPGGGERFATWIPGTSAPVSFDVTPQVMAALAADKQLSVQLFSIGTNSVDYASRENSNPTNIPQLVLALVPLPQFTNAVYVGGGFAFAGTGPAGQPYRVFATTNISLPFANWTAISTGTFDGGVFTYTNPQATNQTQQFYRLISP